MHRNQYTGQHIKWVYCVIVQNVKNIFTYMHTSIYKYIYMYIYIYPFFYFSFHPSSFTALLASIAAVWPCPWLPWCRVTWCRGEGNLIPPLHTSTHAPHSYPSLLTPSSTYFTFLPTSLSVLLSCLPIFLVSPLYLPFPTLLSPLFHPLPSYASPSLPVTFPQERTSLEGNPTLL